MEVFREGVVALAVEQFLREPWRKGKPALGVWSTVGNALVVEALAAAGPDYVCVDMQHGTATESQLVELTQAVAAGGSVPIVRVPYLYPASIMKALDAGARGVIVPLVESGEEAALAVSACRYPPAGTRSFGPFRASMQAGTDDVRELEKVAILVMIETRKGIDNLSQIVATEGLTGVYLGPSDLSLALGLPPGSIEAPEFRAVVDRVLAACREHDVIAGMHCYDGATARRAIEQGFDMVTVAVELRAMRQAVTGELRRARANGSDAVK